MSEINYIQILHLCKHYEVEFTFITRLQDFGLIELTTVKNQVCINEVHLSDLEKILRLHKELDINLEGIDTIFHLLNKVENLQKELAEVKGRLGLYE